MITAESGADTLNRNLFLRQRFAFARQRFDRTIALLGLPRLHIPIAKIAVARSRSAGHRGLLRRRRGLKIQIFSPCDPIKPLYHSGLDFQQMRTFFNLLQNASA